MARNTDCTADFNSRYEITYFRKYQAALTWARRDVRKYTSQAVKDTATFSVRR